jgi:hypothetical protein
MQMNAVILGFYFIEPIYKPNDGYLFASIMVTLSFGFD